MKKGSSTRAAVASAFAARCGPISEGLLDVGLRMFIGSTAVARAMQARADFAEVSAKTGEMIVAANAVIRERVAMMVEGARNPRTANYAEFARMLPEKVTAMQQAGTALLDECWSVGVEIGDYMTCVARMMTGNWPPSPCEVAELVEQTSLYGTRMAVTAIDVASVMLVPFHGCATSNASRLSHRERTN